MNVKQQIQQLAENLKPTKAKINNTIEFYSLDEKEREIFELTYMESIRHLTLDEILESFINAQLSWSLVIKAFESTEEYEWAQKVLQIQKEEKREFINCINELHNIRQAQGNMLADQIIKKSFNYCNDNS